jgi:hypothetical protein
MHFVDLACHQVFSNRRDPAANPHMLVSGRIRGFL